MSCLSFWFCFAYMEFVAVQEKAKSPPKSSVQQRIQEFKQASRKHRISSQEFEKFLAQTAPRLWDRRLRKAVRAEGNRENKRAKQASHGEQKAAAKDGRGTEGDKYRDNLTGQIEKSVTQIHTRWNNFQ